MLKGANCVAVRSAFECVIPARIIGELCDGLVIEKEGTNKQTKSRRTSVILEVAILQVKSSQGAEFEAAFEQAQKIIVAMPGYISHQLQHCIEKPNQYILLVNWQTLEDHTVGFRESEPYQQWRELLHHFYEPFPEVEHYERVFGND